jgi:hypothetical protein
LICLAVAQALLGHHSQVRWLWFAERPRPGEPLLKSVRQLIESVNDTLKAQLDLEQHGGRTFEGVAIRIALQRPRTLAGHRPTRRIRCDQGLGAPHHQGLKSPRVKKSRSAALLRRP